MLMLWPAMSWQPGGRGVLLVLQVRLVTNLPSQVLKQHTYHDTVTYCITYKHAGSVVVKAAGRYAHYCGFEAGALHYVSFLYLLFMAN